MTRDADTDVWSVTGTEDRSGITTDVRVLRRLKASLSTISSPILLGQSQPPSIRSQILDGRRIAQAGRLGRHRQTTISCSRIVSAIAYTRFRVSTMKACRSRSAAFRAFTHTDSNGMTHFAKLADAGLTHLHLLPTFDIATIENKDEWRAPLDSFLAGFRPIPTNNKLPSTTCATKMALTGLRSAALHRAGR